MKYERLTRRFRNSQMQQDVELMTTVSNGVFRLAELEDKMEQGTLIELPCKVGDKFYGICDFVIFEYSILAIKLVKDHAICLCTVYDIEFILGKDCFLTLEEAEKRLKELQE